MSSYQTFAQFYDTLTQNAEYKVRADYVSGFFSSYKEEPKVILDLACGTGNISYYLSQKGYEIIGMDKSEDMLSQASSKGIDNLTLVKGDMTSFNLFKKVDCCVCMLDSINHLESIDDVKRCFDCVYNVLNTGGIFIFDVNTVYKHKRILADNSFVFDEEDFFLAWDNEFLGDNKVRILLDFFVYNGNSYDRHSEEFIETAYDIDELSDALKNFEVIGIYDDLSKEAPKEKSERLYFVCKRN